jgi:hypothetical protein
VLTLDTALRIPTQVSFTYVNQEAILLNRQTNFYFGLDDIGAHFWRLLVQGKTLRACHQTLLAEYEVDSARLEKDLLDLINQLAEHHLVEIVPD